MVFEILNINLYLKLIESIKFLLLVIVLSSPPGQKIYQEPRVKDFIKINKSVLSHITFYLEDDDEKPLHFQGETISFTGQLIKR